jgi:hypothetical protein
MGFILGSVVVLQLERCAATVSLVLRGMEMEKNFLAFARNDNKVCVISNAMRDLSSVEPFLQPYVYKPLFGQFLYPLDDFLRLVHYVANLRLDFGARQSF